ncbi:TetR/AcrR family transcriptional regulator [Alteromonas confluentis]|uniref:Transcriptional regulator n=1 Tax=Alteromonas confluentis TaxID=1656094 RepID=A0A1E7ZF13_9ALTE|nr:TetR/AcrR family transcriptional regulator [Alteromonas confluentis]OFC72032.1 transcriptional regulator [Alteromonas confluentis]
MTAKKQLLTETALQLFYARGIHAIGINEILAQSGVAKKTLYHHFASKDELLLAALQLRHERFISWLNESLQQATTGDAAVEKLFMALSSWFNSEEEKLGYFRGCFFINTSAEFSDAESAVFQRCQLHKQVVRETIGRYLQCDEQRLNKVCLLMEGAIVTAQVSGGADAACALAVKILSNDKGQG